MIWISIIFWILLGLEYVGVHVPYQEIVIGICALIIGVVALIGEIKR